MKFAATFNNSYRSQKGNLVHVYSVQLPEDIDVKTFHNSLADVKSRTVCTDGSPRFNSFESDLGVTPPNSIELWLNKQGRLSNLTAIENKRKEEEQLTQAAKEKKALLNAMGISKEDILKSMGLSLTSMDTSTPTAQSANTVEDSVENAVEEPAEEIEDVM